MTPPINAAEIERLARLATPGPWGTELPYRDAEEIWIKVPCPEYPGSTNSIAAVRRGCGEAGGEKENRADAAFIASANPQTLLTLLAALREAKGALRRVELSQDCEHCSTQAGEAIDAIAEKVEGL